MRALVLLGVLACGSTEAPPQADPKPRPVVDIPEVKDVGRVAPFADDARWLHVNVTPTGIAANGQPVAAITDGAIDAAALEGGAPGFKIVKLANATKQWIETAKPTDAVATLMIDRATTYRTLISTMYSIKTSGLKRFEILALSGNEVVSLAITLPDRKPPTAHRIAPDDPAEKLAAKLDDPPPVSIKSKSVTPSSLTADVMVGKVQSAYLRGIERCGAKSPGAHHMKLGFRIDPTGRADRPKVTGVAAAVIECVGAQIAGWRFPIPKAADGTAIEATVEITLDIAAATPEDTHETIVVSHDPVEVPSLKLVVSVDDTQLKLWSIGGSVGTLQQPKLVLGRGGSLRPLQDELRAVVKQQWDGKTRPADSREIILMAHARVPMQQIAELMFAVRQTPDRVELFPDIVLSSGFE